MYYLNEKKYIQALTKTIQPVRFFNKYKYADMFNIFVFSKSILIISAWYSLNFYIDNFGFDNYTAIACTVLVSLLLAIASYFFINDYVKGIFNPVALGICILIFAWNTRADFIGSEGIVNRRIDKPEDIKTNITDQIYDKNIKSLKSDEIAIYQKYAWIYKDSSLVWLRKNIHIPFNGSKWHNKEQCQKDLKMLEEISNKKIELLTLYNKQRLSNINEHDRDLKAYDYKIESLNYNFKFGSLIIALFYVLSIIFRIKFKLMMLKEIHTETDGNATETLRKRTETLKQTTKQVKVDISEGTQEAVIKLIQEGFSNDEICKKLEISKGTITKSKQNQFIKQCPDLNNEELVNERLKSFGLTKSDFIDKYKKSLNGEY